MQVSASQLIYFLVVVVGSCQREGTVAKSDLGEDYRSKDLAASLQKLGERLGFCYMVSEVGY